MYGGQRHWRGFIYTYMWRSHWGGIEDTVIILEEESIREDNSYERATVYVWT
jgi:hypothetical protein